MRITPSIELLEARIAPAGVVAVAYNAGTGELTLTGDALGNTLDVTMTGPGTHRIQVTGDTTLTGGALVQDIGKLTKLTILAGAGDDAFALENLTALTRLSIDAGGGGGEFTINNTKVSGPVNFTGGAGIDLLVFGGFSTKVTGDLTVNDTAGGGVELQLRAQTSVIGGSLLVTGGSGLAELFADANGTLAIGKGVNLQAGSGGSTISFNSQAGTTIGKLPTGESVLFAGGDGTDELSFSGKSATFAGGVVMEGGGFSDRLIFNLPRGAVKIGRLATGQSIVFAAGEDDDTFRAEALSFQAVGSIEFAGGQGVFDGTIGDLGSTVSIGKLRNGESIKFTGGFGNSLTLHGAAIRLAGGIDFASDFGNNSLTIDAPQGAVQIGKLLGGASIKYLGGSESDAVSATAARLNLAGGIDFAGGADINSVTIGGEGGRVQIGKLTTGESVKYVGGAGSDTFTTRAGNFTTAGGVSFAGGDGANAVDFFNSNASAKIGKLATGQSVLYTGGSGADELSSTQARFVLAGGIEFSGGDGNNVVDIDDDAMVQIGTIATGQSVKFTGGGAGDDLFLGGHIVAVKGSIEMAGGSGNNILDLDGASVSVGKRGGVSTSLTGGAGIDKIDLEDNVTLAGSIVLNGNAGDDELDLTRLAMLKIGGDITFNGGAESDRLRLDVFALQIAGKVTFTGGEGNDEASFVAEGEIGGNVTLDLGAAGDGGIQAITLASHLGNPAGLELAGALGITASGAAGTFDLLTNRDVAVHRAINATLGAWASSVAIDNLIASDTFTLATGDGADVVEIERNDVFGNSVIARLATIQTGAGNDTVLIGRVTPPVATGFPDSTRVNFLGGLIVDGGADTDTHNEYAAENTITDTPTLLNFETEIERR